MVAIIDSNSDPDPVTYAIPANDDAIRAISLYCQLMSDAVLDGIQQEMTASGVDIGAAEALPEEQLQAEGEAAEGGAEEAPQAADEDTPGTVADDSAPEAAADDAEAETVAEPPADAAGAEAETVAEAPAKAAGAEAEAVVEPPAEAAGAESAPDETAAEDAGAESAPDETAAEDAGAESAPDETVAEADASDTAAPAEDEAKKSDEAASGGA